MPSTYIAKSGSFSRVKGMHRAVSGVWTKVRGAWRYTNGTWAKVYSSAPSYIRWRIYATKTPGNTCQFSEFAPLLNGAAVSMAGVTAFSGIAGISTAGGEGPAAAIDGSAGTKFNDQSFTANGETQLILYNPNGWEFNGYTWGTGNDSVARDPVNWNVEVSDDGMNWKHCHGVVGFLATATRSANCGTSWTFGTIEEEARPIAIAVSQATTATIAPPAAAKAGDLAIFFDRPLSTSSTAGSSALSDPSGWTRIAYDVWLQNGSSMSQKHNWWGKVLETSDLGVAIAGSTWGSTNRKQIAIFRAGSGRFGSFAMIAGGFATGSTGVPPAQSMDMSSAGSPTIAIAGYGGDTVVARNMTPDPGVYSEDVFGAIAALKWLIQGDSPSSISNLNMPDAGGSNLVTGFWMRMNESGIYNLDGVTISANANAVVSAGTEGGKRIVGSNADAFVRFTDAIKTPVRNGLPVMVMFEARLISGGASITVDYGDGGGSAATLTTVWQTFKLPLTGSGGGWIDFYATGNPTYEIRNLSAIW